MASMLDRANLYHDLSGLNSLRAHQDAPEALKAACQQFESFFTRQLLKTMREANEALDDDTLLDSQGSDFFREMYDDQLSVHLAKSGGLGLAELMFRQVSAVKDAPLTEPGRDAAIPISASSQPMAERTPVVGPSIAPQYPRLGSLTEAKTPAIVDDAGALSRPAPGGAVGKETGREWHALADSAFEAFSQAPSPVSFVRALWPHAKKAANELGVSARLLIAQAALETGWGRSLLPTHGGDSSKNLFNIKAGPGWSGGNNTTLTLEFEDGVAVRKRESFRAYESLADSFKDYVALIQDSPRYRDAVDAVGDVARYAKELQRAGYATDPRYADKIERVYHSDTLVDALRALNF
ncbi:MAG: flagellar assembly peptidoglycan hydrolase FlgJ [Gammaproteobacteria bacterium]|nr:flagellar assembly peptidoglycan hydrolase FlgJ [Gammaproteobacteria bacterium]